MSNAFCAAAIDEIPSVSRSCGSSCMSDAKPVPSAPSRFSTGTSTPSKKSSDVSEERCPSFSRLRPRAKPGRSVSTSTRLRRRAPHWVVLKRAPSPTVLGGGVGAQQAGCTRLVPERPIDDAGPFPRVKVRRDFRLDEPANGVTQQFVFLVVNGAPLEHGQVPIE